VSARGSPRADALRAHRAQLLRLDAERLGQPAQSGEVLGHGGRRAARALERVAVGTHGLRREVGRRRVGAEERAECPIHRGVDAPRFGGALASGNFGGADGQAAGIDELAGERAFRR